MNSIKIGPDEVFVTPLACTHCGADMGAVFALEKNTNEYLCKTKLNFFCDECYQATLTKSGLSK